MQKKYLLDEERIPRRWYNIAPDFPEPPAPPLHPGTGQPAGPDDLAAFFPMGLIAQEASMESYIDIPDEVRDIYRIWRPTPLIRATGLEKALGLRDDVRIFFKYEGVSPSGSHKSNTAVAQAYYNKEAGVKRLATETGAGQWGSALHGLPDLRHRPDRLHGQGELLPEALPARADGDQRRRRSRQPDRLHRDRP
jgi:Predicted alternative tryptophan synthase beta-subunit (paralog of TrpB)